MTGRKIIFECRTGSHLYGTNTPTSDEDFKGVFLPSAEDLLGMQSCPGEWSLNEKVSAGPRNTAGDVDRKYFSIKKFLDLACQGQPGQLEMLFVPDNMILTSSHQWRFLRSRQRMFLSKNGIKPFLGFATSQAHKAVIKGENLSLIRELISELTINVQRESRVLVQDLMSSPHEGVVALCVPGLKVKYLVNEHGYPQLEIAGRQFNPGILAKTMLNSLEIMEARYGTRTKAAAEQGYDYKSLSHAVRLISEAEEFLLHGTITMPRPDAQLILQVKRGEIERDWFGFLLGEIERIEVDVLPRSQLPEQPNRSTLNDLCIDMLRTHLTKE